MFATNLICNLTPVGDYFSKGIMPRGHKKKKNKNHPVPYFEKLSD